MPPGNPGGLSGDKRRALAVYILSENGVALAGDAPSGPEAPVKPVQGEHAAASGGVGDAVRNEDEIFRAVLDRRARALGQMGPVSEAELRGPPPKTGCNGAAPTMAMDSAH